MLAALPFAPCDCRTRTRDTQERAGTERCVRRASRASRAQLHPALRVAKGDALVLRRVDIVRPEEADVPVLESVLRGPAAECEVDIVWGPELESRPAFEVIVRRWRLV